MVRSSLGTFFFILVLALLLGGVSSCHTKRPFTRSSQSGSQSLASDCDTLHSLTVRKARIRYRDDQGRDISVNAQFYVHRDSGIFVSASFLGIEFARGYANDKGFKLLNRMERICYSGDASSYLRHLGTSFSSDLFFLLFTGMECVANNVPSFRVVRSSHSQILLEDAHRGSRLLMEKSDFPGWIDQVVLSGGQGLVQSKILERMPAPSFLPVSLYWEISGTGGAMKRRADVELSEISVNEIHPVRFSVPAHYEVKTI